MAYARTTTVDTGPAGDTIVQGITDLDTDLTAIYTDLNTHEALTETHGATGTIVGTTNTQIITNKTLYSPTISGGSFTGTVSWIPAGTKMVFYQDVAPTGWTIANTLDDKVLFVTKGSAAGGETGGGAHSSGTWTQPNHTHTGPSHTHTGPSHTHTGPSHTHTTGDWTITIDQMPSHTHGIGSTVSAASVGGTVNNASANTGYYSTARGGDKPHNHGATGAGGTGNTGDGGTGATGASGTANTGASAAANTWRPAAYCVIIATKD